MIECSDLRLALFAGPSVFAPFAAVMLEFRGPDVAAAPAEVLEARLRALLDPRLQPRFLPLPRPAGFVALVAQFSALLHEWRDPGHPEPVVLRGDDGLNRILLAHVDAAAAGLALRSGLQLATALFRAQAGEAVRVDELNARLLGAITRISTRQPDSIAAALIGAARRRGIPVQAVSPASRIWIYGQGSRAIHLFEAASSRDALTGSKISSNKYISNQLVTGMGFPGVTHSIAPTVEAARQIADGIGYPVVVKPLAGAKGKGVTAQVLDERELATAFSTAQSAGQGDVLVERHVDGTDYRLVVIGGRMVWAVKRLPPQVTGDGRQTVVELLAESNRHRAASVLGRFHPGGVSIDDEILEVLRRQGLDSRSVPASGRVVPLRRIANLSRGGTLVPCTDSVHPDNREMAEAIARGLHLDAVGIDFMTPDVARSWREVECAVLEVNSTPGISSDSSAERVLAARFPNGMDGRIPSIVLVDAGPQLLEAVVAAAAAAGCRLGWTDGRETRVDGQLRLKAQASLPDRVTALILDPACEAMVIAATAQDLREHGFPLERCDLALVAPALAADESLARLVAGCAGSLRQCDLEPDAATLETLRREVLAILASST